MKKFIIAILSLILLSLGYMFFLSPSAVDENKHAAIWLNINLGKLINPHPSINQILGDGEFREGYNPVRFTEKFQHRISDIYDVQYVDFTCGRLFFLQEKNIFGGYKRTFVLHQELANMRTRPIIISNRSSQNTQFDQFNRNRKALEDTQVQER